MCKQPRIPFLLLAMWLITADGVSAQSFPEFRFSQLNQVQGLPTNFTTFIIRDRKGFLWIGTETNGLFRYDGRQVKSYFDRALINDGHIAYLSEDRSGMLWVGTLNGLYQLDPVTQLVTHYVHSDTDSFSLATNEKPHPFVDSKGRIWVGSNKGLQLFDPATKTFHECALPEVSNSAWKLHENDISFFYEDRNGVLWTGSAYGVYQIDTVTRSVKSFLTGRYQFATSMIKDHNNCYWVSFWNGGLQQFFPETGRFKEVPGLPSVILKIEEWKDPDDHHWLVLLESDGIILFDPVTSKSRRYLKHDPVSLLKGSLMKTLFIDEEQRLWVAGNAGINLLDRAIQGFRVIHLGDGRPDYAIAGKDPKALLVERDDYLVSSWYGDGLYVLDKHWQIKNHIRAIPPGSTSVSSMSIYTIRKDGDGHLWYGTDSGLVRQSDHTYTVFLPDDDYPAIDERYAARDLVEQKNGESWVRFLARGVYRFDKAKGRFGKNYRRQFKGDAVALLEDHRGELWLFSREAIYRYHPPADSFIQVIVRKGTDQHGPDYPMPNQVFFDEHNIAWIASVKGLVRFDPISCRMELIQDPSRKNAQAVSRLLQDSTGTIWMESVSELIAYDPVEKTFRYFSSALGLLPDYMASTNVFNWIDDHTIAAGSVGTLTLFNPYTFGSSGAPASLLVTDVEADGRRIIPDSLAIPVTIRLTTAAKKLVIHFSYLNFTAGASNRLFYRMKNNSEDWNESVDGDILLYNLPHGKYELDLKGVNTAGFSSDIVMQVVVMVPPRWYQTNLFRAGLLFIMSCVIYLVARARAQAEKKQLVTSQRIVETEMAALKAQMNPHFLFNCINSIDAFIQTNDRYNATLYLNKFAKLIRNVLDSSKENLVPFFKDIETLRLYIELEELRSDHAFVTRVDIDPELMNSDYKVPPLIIQPFVENAILHGLRNRPGKTGRLDIVVQKIENEIEYRIRDNGIGIQQSAKLNEGKQRSYGMQMSFDRIKLFNKEETPSVYIENVYDNGNPAGTLIIAKLIII